MKWFYMISYPFMSLTQPGVTTVMDEALSDVPSDVKQPQHALVCVAPGQFATDYMKWRNGLHISKLVHNFLWLVYDNRLTSSDMSEK